MDKKWILGLLGIVALISISSVVFADDAGMMSMDDTGTGHALHTTNMHASMMPFHIAQIIISLIVSSYIFIIIRQTGQIKTFIYALTAMTLFIVSSAVGYFPHLGLMADFTAQITSLIIVTIALALIGITFNFAVKEVSK